MFPGEVILTYLELARKSNTCYYGINALMFTGAASRALESPRSDSDHHHRRDVNVFSLRRAETPESGDAQEPCDYQLLRY